MATAEQEYREESFSPIGRLVTLSTSQRIKFRCTSCEKPLSIGRKKIGATVTCPRCKSKIVVEEQSDPDESNSFDEFEVYDEPELVYSETEVKRSESKLNDRLSVPRRIVYFQGSLLGIVALLFFLLGLMVGFANSGGNRENDSNSKITGTILVEGDNGIIADEGAVVFLMPAGSRPPQRFNAEELQPGRTFTGNNPEVPLIRGFGGNVCTANRAGTFYATVPSDREYLLVVISAKGKRSGKIPSDYYSELGHLFTSLDQLADDRVCYFKRILPTKANERIGEIRLN